MRKFRLTKYFIITALMVMTFTTIAVNLIAIHLAEETLVRITEENTVRDAAHIQSMIRGEHAMPHMSTVGAAHTGDAVRQPQMPIPSPEDTDDGRPTEQSRRPDVLTLDFLAGPDGLSRSLPALVEGLNIVKFNLFDLRGNTVWSTDPATLGITKRESPLYQEAVSGGIGSKLAKKHDIVDLDGVSRRIDLVETYMPLMESPSGRLMGVMEIYRDVTDDFSIQVLDTKATVLRTTVATMAGLFLVFAGFIVVADILIYRANRGELSVVEGQLGERKRSQAALQRSEEQAKRLAKENSVLAEIGRVVSSSLEINDVYDRFADQVLELIHYDRIVITVVDVENRTGVASYVRGLDIPGRDAGNSHATEFTITEALDLKRSGIIIESESIGAVPVQFPDEVFYVAAGFRSMIAVPLIANDQVIGTLTMRSTKSRSYTERDLALAERIGTQIAGALSITQLYAQRRKAEQALAEQAVELQRQRLRRETASYVGQLERAVADLKRSRRRIVAVQEEAKKALAEELHGPVQTRMYMLYLKLGKVRDMIDASPQEARANLAEAAAELDSIRENEIRMVSHRLHPSIIDVGLGAGIRSLRDKFEEQVPISLEVGKAIVEREPPGSSALPFDVRLGLYRVVEEALANIIKHSGASSVSVHLHLDDSDGSLSLAVEDNGSGFDYDAPRPGLGMVTMEDHLGALGGSLHVNSAPGKGTRITATVPLDIESNDLAAD